jgi:protein SCO1/2
MNRRRVRNVMLGLTAAAAIAAVAAVVAAVSSARQQGSAPSPTLEQLSRYGTAPEFTLTERSARAVTRADLRGLVWVADFIYTECKESCPTQSAQLAQLAREFGQAADLRLVSITVDPQHDTPRVLRSYAERYGADARWWFLTGDTRAIYCLAREGFRLAVVDPRATKPVECGDAFRLGPAAAWASHGSGALVMHSARVVLVDRVAEIRAYHLATDQASMTALRANLRTVLAEADASR